MSPSDLLTAAARQIESLRGAVRYLRSENAYLKSRDLFKQLNTLPSYTVDPPRFPPSLDAASSAQHVSAPDTHEDRARRFGAESKALLKKVAEISSRPKVVDLSLAKRGQTGQGWQARSRLPLEQFTRRKEEVDRLRKKIESLKELRTAL